MYMRTTLRDLAPTFGDIRRPAARRVRAHPGGAPTSTAPPFTSRTTRSPRRTPGASGSRRRASRHRSGWTPRAIRSGTVTGVVRRCRPDGHDRPTGVRLRHPGLGLDVHGGADRAGRLQRRSGARVRQDTAAVRLRGVRAGRAAPICSVDPSTVPKVMDTVPPAGVPSPTNWTRRSGQCSCGEVPALGLEQPGDQQRRPRVPSVSGG